MIEMLLAAGADANATSPDGETTLMTAARTGNAAAVKVLLADGAKVNATEKWQGQTALMWAAAQNHREVIALLIEDGAEINGRSKPLEFGKISFNGSTMVSTPMPRGGMTALMFAARQGALEGVRALAEGGADLNLTDPDGTSALVMAIVNATTRSRRSCSRRARIPTSPIPAAWPRCMPPWTCTRLVRSSIGPRASPPATSTPWIS